MMRIDLLWLLTVSRTLVILLEHNDFASYQSPTQNSQAKSRISYTRVDNISTDAPNNCNARLLLFVLLWSHGRGAQEATPGNDVTL